MKWVTRERPKIDRIACTWLVTRFIDDDPEFLYVPTVEVFDVAKREGAIAYDIPGAELSHVGDLYSFDAFLKRYDLHDPALDQLALIVRGADTSRLDLTRQSAGLSAISLGLSANYPDDHAMLGQGLVLYDALYRWCQSCQGQPTTGHLSDYAGLQRRPEQVAGLHRANYRYFMSRLLFPERDILLVLIVDWRGRNQRKAALAAWKGATASLVNDR